MTAGRGRRPNPSPPAELYPSGGVSVGQVGTVLAAAESVEVVQRLHASQGVGDHGDGAGSHQGDVVRRAAQGEGIVGGTGEPQRVVALQGLALVVLLVLQLLLHLQRHQLLALQVRHIVGRGRSPGRGGVALWRGKAAAGVVPPFVFLVVESGKGQNVEEEQRRPHGDGDAQLSGVIPLGLDDHRGLVTQVAAQALVRALLVVVCGRKPRVACGGRPVVLPGEALGVRVRGGVLGGYLGGCGHILEKLIDVVEMGNQFQPERHLGGSVVVPDSGFEADVKVKLVLGVVLCPGDLLKAVGLGVDELGVLRNRLVGIPERGREEVMRSVSLRFSLPCFHCLPSASTGHKQTFFKVLGQTFLSD